MQKFFAGLLMLLVVGTTMAQTSVLPVDNYNPYVVSTCIDNSTLVNSISVYRCVNSVCSTINSNASISCQFGCDASAQPNKCLPAPSQINIIFWIVVILVILFMVGFFSWALRRR